MSDSSRWHPESQKDADAAYQDECHNRHRLGVEPCGLAYLHTPAAPPQYSAAQRERAIEAVAKLIRDNKAWDGYQIKPAPQLALSVVDAVIAALQGEDKQSG